jgi:hypothetical protein
MNEKVVLRGSEQKVKAKQTTTMCVGQGLLTRRPKDWQTTRLVWYDTVGHNPKCNANNELPECDLRRH